MRADRPELPGLISMTPIEDLLDLGSRMGVGGRSDVGSPSEARSELGSELPATAWGSDPRSQSIVSGGLGPLA